MNAHRLTLTHARLKKSVIKILSAILPKAIPEAETHVSAILSVLPVGQQQSPLNLIIVKKLPNRLLRRLAAPLHAIKSLMIFAKHHVLISDIILPTKAAAIPAQQEPSRMIRDMIWSAMNVQQRMRTVRVQVASIPLKQVITITLLPECVPKTKK